MGGSPMIDYAVDRLRAAAAEEIRVVVRPEKVDLVERARVLGLTVVEAWPPTLAESVLAGVAGLLEDDIVLLDLPDSIWEPVDGFKLLLRALTEETDVVLAVFRSAEPWRGDVVEVGSAERVLAVHAKAADPPGELIWGAAAARTGALADLGRYAQPGELFDGLARGGRVRAVRFPGEFIDIGTKEALARAREQFS